MKTQKAHSSESIISTRSITLVSLFCKYKEEVSSKEIMADNIFQTENSSLSFFLNNHL